MWKIIYFITAMSGNKQRNRVLHAGHSTRICAVCYMGTVKKRSTVIVIQLPLSLLPLSVTIAFIPLVTKVTPISSMRKNSRRKLTERCSFWTGQLIKLRTKSKASESEIPAFAVQPEFVTVTCDEKF